MKYAVQLTRSARKDVLALEDPLYSRISEAINALEENRDLKKLGNCAVGKRHGAFAWGTTD